jgi:tetratricopeptide (TPR) repeat protein
VEIVSTLNEQILPVERTGAKAPARKPVLDLSDLYLILQLEPNDSLIALELGQRLASLGRCEEALRVLRNVVRIDSRFETLSALGLLEYRMDMTDEALHHLQQSVLIAPENEEGLFEIYKTLGNIFVRRAEFDLAEDNYNKAHRLDTDSDVLWVNLGTLMIQKASWDDALERFRKALEINRTNDKAWVGLAIGHRMKGDWELAWGNIEAALEYNPLNEVALNLALEWGVHEDREFRVLELIRTFLIEGGWDEKLSLAFAWLSHRRGETHIARFELERLLAVNPANLRAHDLLTALRTDV